MKSHSFWWHWTLRLHHANKNSLVSPFAPAWGFAISIFHLWAVAEFSFNLWHSFLRFVPICILGSPKISQWPNLDCNSQGLNYNLCCNQVSEQMISVLWYWWELCPWKLEPRESQMVPSTLLMGARSCAGRAVSALLCWTIMRANFVLHPLTQAHMHIFGGWHIWLSNLLFLWLTVGRGWWVIFMTKRLLFGAPFQLADEKQRHTAIFNEHSTALSRDIFFWIFFCNRNSFSTEVYTFLENECIYIYTYI